ncbi:MAG: protein-L-isoaspartate(D-aspartate) O-methyltransferase [Rickettsiales bacterium]
MDIIEESHEFFQKSPSVCPASFQSSSNKIRLLMNLRNGGVYDNSVLGVMETIPRELFVEDPFIEHAYDDTALPIACGQTISQPMVVAKMTIALSVKPRMRVLEIGTGSGYQAAILSKMARMIYTVERHRDLMEVAEKRFAELNINNIALRCANGSKGWKEAAPFERIMVTAAAKEVPESLIEQLSAGGIMIIPVGYEAGVQKLLRITKKEDGSIITEDLMDVRFVPLVEDR